MSLKSVFGFISGPIEAVAGLVPKVVGGVTGISAFFAGAKGIFYAVVVALVAILLIISKCSHPPEVSVISTPDVTPAIVQQVLVDNNAAIAEDTHKAEVAEKTSDTVKLTLDKKISKVKASATTTPVQQDAQIAAAQIDAIAEAYQSYYGNPSKTIT